MARMLTDELFRDDSFWRGKGHCLFPEYDRAKLPVTAICFSPGRMGFGHFADILQDLMNQGVDAGMICGVESFSQSYYNDVVANDFLCTHVIYGPQKGEAEVKFQGAFKNMLFLDANTKSLSWRRLLDYACDKRVQYATINAPEAAYGMRYFGGDYAEPTSARVKEDMEKGTVQSDPGKWTYFLLERYKAGLKFAIVSCTNFSKNGFFTAATVRTMARAWEQNGFAPKGFEAYVADRSQVGFPNTMIDRIAVSPDAAVYELLEKVGVVSSVVVTEQNRYWAIEDCFPNGRPDFDKAEGVFMCKDFEDVKKYEDMKLRILNMSHTTIAGYGVCLGYRGEYGIYRAMQNKEITDMITGIISVVTRIIEKPENIRVEDFVADTYARLNNPNIPDDPMRIALGCSTKVLPRFMDTYWEAKEVGIPAEELTCILKATAGVLCYCCGKDIHGENFELSADPILETLKKCGADALAGVETKKAFQPLLSDPAVMGKDLFSEPETLKALIAQTDALLAKIR